MRKFNEFELRHQEAETTLTELAKYIGPKLPKGFGFALWLFNFTGPELFYTGNSDRADVIKMMKEFIDNYEYKVVDGVNRR